jgi:DNA-binding SARP family transcriptional activator/tetratricopeptide (TPR) repeat protein
MRVRLLGPVDVMVDGEERPVAGLRRKAVLATLALQAGEVVSTDRLVDAVWGESAPLTALNTLQHHVSHLRAVLGSKAAIIARPPGYLLDLGEDGTDVQLAERLLRQGTRSADPRQGVQELREALDLWRGRPLADVVGLAWLEDQAGRLDLLRQRIRGALSEARLAAGDHVLLVPELEQMVADHPLNEQVHAQLIVALYRCGRQADALSAYQRLRATLAEELGIDTSQPLRDLETAILRQDPSLDAPVRAGSLWLSAPAVPIPAQLPAGVAGFAGRGAELVSLDTILSQVPTDGTSKSAAVVITAIAGTAGVGKTALAVHWAHRVAAQFPDGQLYTNLRGFDSAGSAAEPAQALRGFLDALAVPPERIPARLDDQAALYRSLLAGKRMLVVLDNARDAEQVRVLLPGAPGCLAIVTSRNRLTGLIARDGAHLLGLDVLTPAGARELLTRRLGAKRVDSEPNAVGEIITRCARLPLALTIAAARAADSPGFPLAHFAAEMRDPGQVLDPFGGEDAATDVRAMFSWSYRALSTDAARLFRLLGLHPGPDITVGAAASLAGIVPERVRVLLAELTRGHLLTEHHPDRYAFHDLLRTYAAEQARTHDDDGARSAAVGRLLDHCLHTAHAAATLIDPYFAPAAAPAPSHPGAVIGGPATAEEALSWFTVERPTLLAAVPLAAESGCATHAWQLAWALSTYLLRQGFWTEQATACHIALDAARRAGHTAGEANALVLLGLGYGPSGRLSEATSHLHQALRLLDAAGGGYRSRVRAHKTLSWIAEQQERPADTLSHATAALELSREAGDLALEVMSLNDVGYSHALLGNYGQAIRYCERSLAGSQEAGELNWESAAWDSLAYIHHQLGSYRCAITCYERSLNLCRELADRFNEAGTLDRLGDVHRSAGDMDAACSAWAQAVRTFDEIGHPGGEQIRAKLRSLDGPLLAGTSGQPAVSASYP